MQRKYNVLQYQLHLALASFMNINISRGSAAKQFRSGGLLMTINNLLLKLFWKSVNISTWWLTSVDYPEYYTTICLLSRFSITFYITQTIQCRISTSGEIASFFLSSTVLFSYCSHNGKVTNNLLIKLTKINTSTSTCNVFHEVS